MNKEDIDRLTIDERLVLMTALREQGKENLKDAAYIEYTVTSQMEADGATKIDTDHFSGRVVPGKLRHNITEDAALLAELSEVLRPEQMEGLTYEVPARRVISQRAANDLAKLGEPVKGIIEKYRKTTRGEPTLDVNPKEAK